MGFWILTAEYTATPVRSSCITGMWDSSCQLCDFWQCRMDWSGFSWILLTHWLIRFVTNKLHCSLHYMYLCDRESNNVMSYWRAGQQEPNRGPHNLLRTCLRAALMYAYIKGSGTVFTRMPLFTNNKCYVLLYLHPCVIFFKWSQLGAHYFLIYLFQLLYKFRATMCPSSGELTGSIFHLNPA